MLTFSRRIILMPLLAAAAFLLVVGVTLHYSRENRRQLALIEAGYVPAMELGRDLVAHLAEIQRRMQDAVGAEEPEWLAEGDALRDEFLRHIARERGNAFIDGGELEGIEREFTGYYTLLRESSLQIIEGASDDATQAGLQRMLERYNQLSGRLEAFQAGTRSAMARALAEAHASLRRAALRVSLIVLLCLLALGALSWAAIRSVTRPIAALADAAAALGQGELERRVAVASRDEIGVLAGAFNRMAGDLGVLLRERDAARRSLEEANEALEQRVRERTAQLAAANRELEAFSYSVSHDLRAPLRGIDGFSLALLEEYRGRLDATAQDYLARIRAGCVRMGLLIDDLLQLSRLTRAPMRRERVDLSALAAAVAAELRQAEPGRDVTVAVEPGLAAEGDSSLLRAALTNLIGNAWKFTRGTPGARIEFGARRERGRVVYHVRDNGAGFDMRYADKLFGAFQRLHSQREFEGTGIGLATVQRIVHRHGGEIRAEGAPGAGAAFHFTLEGEAT